MPIPASSAPGYQPQAAVINQQNSQAAHGLDVAPSRLHHGVDEVRSMHPAVHAEPIQPSTPHTPDVAPAPPWPLPPGPLLVTKDGVSQGIPFTWPAARAVPDAPLDTAAAQARPPRSLQQPPSFTQPDVAQHSTAQHSCSDPMRSAPGAEHPGGAGLQGRAHGAGMHHVECDGRLAQQEGDGARLEMGVRRPPSAGSPVHQGSVDAPGRSHTQMSDADARAGDCAVDHPQGCDGRGTGDCSGGGAVFEEPGRGGGVCELGHALGAARGGTGRGEDFSSGRDAEACAAGGRGAAHARIQADGMRAAACQAQEERGSCISEQLAELLQDSDGEEDVRVASPRAQSARADGLGEGLAAANDVIQPEATLRHAGRGVPLDAAAVPCMSAAVQTGGVRPRAAEWLSHAGATCKAHGAAVVGEAGVVGATEPDLRPPRTEASDASVQVGAGLAQFGQPPCVVARATCTEVPPAPPAVRVDAAAGAPPLLPMHSPRSVWQ